MYTPYEKIYDNLLPKFRSYEIPLMTTEEVKDYLLDFLMTAIPKFHVCRKNLQDRDDILQRFNVELSDIEIEILSNYLLLDRYIFINVDWYNQRKWKNNHRKTYIN